MHLMGFILRLLGLVFILVSIFFGIFCILRSKKSLSPQEGKTQNHSRTTAGGIILAIGCFLDVAGDILLRVG